MKIEKMAPISVDAFHYDKNSEEVTPHQQVNFGLRQVIKENQDGTKDEGEAGNFFELRIIYEVAPAAVPFTVSGSISQVVQLIGYQGDGSDLKPADYQMLSRPLVEMLESLIYETTQLTLKEPVNLQFKANFANR